MRAQAFIPRYSFGVYPVTFLNIRLRWCGYWNHPAVEKTRPSHRFAAGPSL